MFLLCIESSHIRGMGHLFRSLTLADALTKKGHKVVFVMNEHAASQTILCERGYEPITVDLQDTKNNWEAEIAKCTGARVWINDRLDTHAAHTQRVKDGGLKLVTFDDRGSGAELADLHIAALHFDATPLAGKKLLQGADYLLLNPLIAKFQRTRTEERSLLVTLGGSDTYGVTIKILRLLKTLRKKATIVIGPAFMHHDELSAALTSDFNFKHGVPSMIEEMWQHDLAITGGGMTPFEAGASGLPCIVIANETFEIPVSKALEKLGSSVFAGHHEQLDESVFKRELPIQNMSLSGQKNIGLDGAARIVSALEELL